MWGLKFWKAAMERAVRAGASTVLASVLVADGVFNLTDVGSIQEGGVLFLGGAVFSLLFSLAGGALPGTGGAGPSLLGTERLPSKG